MQHSVSSRSVSLAWTTPLFELYCVAGPNASRSALAQGANKVVQWVRQEDESVFIIGGAVSEYNLPSEESHAHSLKGFLTSANP